MFLWFLWWYISACWAKWPLFLLNLNVCRAFSGGRSSLTVLRPFWGEWNPLQSWPSSMDSDTPIVNDAPPKQVLQNNECKRPRKKRCLWKHRFHTKKCPFFKENGMFLLENKKGLFTRNHLHHPHQSFFQVGFKVCIVEQKMTELRKKIWIHLDSFQDFTNQDLVEIMLITL